MKALANPGPTGATSRRSSTSDDIWGALIEKSDGDD